MSTEPGTEGALTGKDAVETRERAVAARTELTGTRADLERREAAAMAQDAHSRVRMSHVGEKMDLKGYGDLVVGPPDLEDEGDDS